MTWLTGQLALLTLACFSYLGGAGAELQYFMQTPQNTSVAEGDTAILSCKVGNLQGRVQWTKDGLTMGFDRDLPGFPRYRVLGSDEAGEYNLQISEASLADDGKYECQVGPAASNLPIRASSYLTVLLPPKRIEIVGHRSGSRIEKRENEKVEVSCKVSNSKPAAEVAWFRNNVPFNPGKDNVEVKEEEGNMVGRKTVISKIKFSASSQDNQATYACEAVHGGLRATNMRVSFLLSVQYPPERPEILGYTEGETVRMGQTVSLVCESYGGNPLASIIWYKNGQRVDHSYTTMGSKSKNVLRFVAAADDNNAKYRCEATNVMLTEPLAAEIVMSVFFAPDTLTITGPDTAKINDTLSLECVTSNSNPASSIQWVVDGRIVPPTATSNDTSADGGWITKSTASIRISSSDRNKDVSCYANNFALSTTKVQTHRIKVLYPPDDLTITGYTQGDIVLEGTERKIQCTAVSGNPLPKLDWFAGDVKIENAAVEEGGAESYISSEITVRADRADNQRAYECRGSNEAIPDSPVKRGFRMAVEFPPRVVAISVEPANPVEGQSAILICQTDSSNPAVELRWRHNGNLLPTTDSSSADGPFGGRVTTNVLQIDVTTQHVGAVFTCEARHNATQSTVHNSTILSIKYRPQFTDPVKEFPIEIGKSASLTLAVKAFPAVGAADFSWTKEGGIAITSQAKAVPGTRILADGGTIHFKDVVLEDGGNYILEVKNEVGASTLTVKVAILYPPRFLDSAKVVEVDVGRPAEIRCNVDAMPLTDSTISWRREGYDLAGRAKTQVAGSGSVLTILAAEIPDSGVFLCVANNGVPKAAPAEISQTFYLLVRHKPMIDKSPGLAKAASNRGQKAELVCRARGASDITFSWQKEGQQLATPTQLAQGTTKYSVVATKTDPLTWESRLTIENVGSQDYGEYKCVAGNVMGLDEHVILLNVKSQPDPPQDLQVVNVTYNSVFLTWQPGFNGGFPQSYRVRMKKAGSEHHFTVEVRPPDATLFQVQDLQMGSRYSFAVMAFNEMGESEYTTTSVLATTASRPPPGVQARAIDTVLEVKGEIPFIIIVSVSVAGVLLLLLNIVLVSCFVQRRCTVSSRETTDGGSSSASSKSATIEMFVGSSYNETLSGDLGDTLSQVSDKSSNYFTSDIEHRSRHFQDDYEEDPRVGGPASTYLIDHNPIYSSQLPQHPPHTSLYGTMPRKNTAYTYEEDLSRQRFIHSLGEDNRGYPVPPLTGGSYAFQYELPPPPPPPPESSPYTYQNLPPSTLNRPWKGQRFGDV